MTLILGFGIPGQSSRSVRIPERTTSNSLIVVVGENGTRKSLLLRQLATAGLGDVPRSRSVNSIDSLGFTDFLTLPSRVIAISATATDRFPVRSRRGDLIKRTRYDVDNYVYVGPRSARNLISRSNSMSELVYGLVADPNAFCYKRKLFQRTLEMVGAAEEFSVELAVREFNSKTHEKPLSLEEYLLGPLQHTKAHAGRSALNDDVANAVTQALSSGLGLRMIRSFDEMMFAGSKTWPPPSGSLKWRGSALLTFNSLTGEVGAGGFSFEALELALATGYLTPRKLHFGNASEEAFSAGQWAICSTILSLAVNARNSCLVLVDEPENGLHPAWQRKYISLIFDAISHVEGCAVVVATHSPLVVGSAPYENSTIVALSETADGVIAPSLISSPDGWDSNSILDGVFGVDSSRSEKVEDLLNRALGLIAEGIPENRSALGSLKGELEIIADRLDDDDELVATIRTIVRVIG